MSNIRLQCVDGSGNPVFLVNDSGIVTTSSALLTNAIITTQTVGTSRVTTSIIGTGNSNTIGTLITTGGNIGIGISTPTGRLDVRSTSDGTGSLVAQFGGSNTPRILFYEHGVGVGGKIYFNSTNPAIFEGGGNIILNQGGTGIGIKATSPGYTLDTNGDISIRNGDGADTFSKNQLVFGFGGSNNYAHAIKTRHQAGLNNSNNAIDFYVWQTSNSAGSVGDKNIMSITSQGVGIGNQYPNGTLHTKTTSGNCNVIIDSAHVGGNSLLEFYSNGTRRSAIWKYDSSDNLSVWMDSVAADVLTIRTSGNIGIINPSPIASLDINASNTFGQLSLGNTVQNRKLVLYNTETDDHHFYGFGINAGVLRYQIDYALTNSHVFCAAASSSSSNELMRIRGDGRVGIGVASPAFALDVNGDIAIPYGNAICQSSWSNKKIIETIWTGTKDQTRIYAAGAQGGGDTPKLVMQNDGFVGIGTTSPAKTLDINGDSVFQSSGSGLVTTMYLTNYNVTYGSAMGMAMGQGSQWARMYTTNVDANTNRFDIDMTGNSSTYSNMITMTNNSAGTVRVGILNTSPQYTLDVAGHINVNGFASRTIGSYAFFSSSGSVSTSSSSPNNYSVYASNRIAASQFEAYSDQRIKTNIQDINDASALETIRAIEPKRYTYIDKVGRGETTVWGFIAQQVGSVLDYSTKQIESYIPNIYKKANIVSNTGGSILSSQDLDTSILDITKTNDNKIHLRIYIAKDDIERMLEVNVKQIISGTELQLEQILDTDTNEVFVYGQKVNDFHTLNKDAIFTVSVAALQEVDRQLQTAKESFNNKQPTLDTMTQQVQDILSRLTTANL
jgi:hypothetical protein